MMKTTCHVHLKHHSYPIYIGSGLLKDPFWVKAHIPHSKVMIVTNPSIASWYLPLIQSQFQNSQCDVTLLPEGEAFKNLNILYLIFDELLTHGHHRDTCIIALGGGVIGDMAGFAASCYQRGVPFIQIPTSLLAQVDSSVGGKTGVNHPLGKNMIGAFYQPQAVVIDTETLQTLPTREFNAGLAEVIKYGLMFDKEFFEWLEKNMDKILAKDPEALQTTLHRCCEIKAEIVSKDEREEGLRALLNFGHTFGHAFEGAQGYGEWLHGEAVAAGMMVALYLSMDCSESLSLEDIQRVERLLKKCQLPTQAPQSVSIKDCLAWMRRDKKIKDDKMRFILLHSLGEAFIHETVPMEKVMMALEQSGLSKEC